MTLADLQAFALATQTALRRAEKRALDRRDVYAARTFAGAAQDVADVLREAGVEPLPITGWSAT